jgi:hypothetical protein
MVLRNGRRNDEGERGEGMTRDDIIRMAHEAGLVMYDYSDPSLERFANLVAAAERERILDMCKEGLWDGEGIRFHLEKRGQV